MERLGVLCTLGRSRKAQEAPPAAFGSFTGPLKHHSDEGPERSVRI
jgi:hypothetical protein